MKEMTLAIIKPDGVSRNLVGEIIKRMEQENLSIRAMKMVRMTKEQARGFYKIHEEKSFFNSLTKFMSSGRCIVMVLEGEKAISRYRKLMGATDYTKADEGTLRHAFATDIEKNVVHGSDSKKTAKYEIAYFFNKLEIVS
jgi:nucleoside-diphosphate kinase